MKKHLTSAVLLLVSMAAFWACSETEAYDDHANWKQRNTDFMAAIADSCDKIGRAHV